MRLTEQCLHDILIDEEVQMQEPLACALLKGSQQDSMSTI
jgi:hypothetical protein